MTAEKLTNPLGFVPMLLVLLTLSPTGAALAQDEAGEGQSQAQQAFAEAQKLLDEGEFQQAVSAYGQLITATGGFRPEPYLKRAEAYIGLGNYESALKDTNDAISYSAGLAQLVSAAKAKRGEIYLELGNIDDALQDLQAATNELPPSAELKFLLGKAQVLRGLAAEGSETLTEYLDLDDPEFEDRELEVYRLRAQAYAGLRRFDDAKADLDKAIDIDSTEHETYVTKASIFVTEEDYTNAAQAFGEAIENYTPEDENNDLPPFQLYLARASAFEEIGRLATADAERNAAFQAAKTQAEQLLELLPDRPELIGIVAQAQLQLGKAERMLENLPAAIKALTVTIDNSSSETPEVLGQAYFRRGICFFYLKEEQLALLDFEAAAGQLITDARPNLWKGRTHASLGEYLDAIRTYSEAIAVNDRFADAYNHRGLAYLRVEDYDKALDNFNEAIRIEPTNGIPYYYRGATFSRLGDSDRAINSYTNAIKFDPELVSAYRAIADELRRTGQGSLATQYDQRANELDSAKAQAAAGSGTR